MMNNSSFVNSSRPYTPTELVYKLSSDNNVNSRTAKKHIKGLLQNGSLQKHNIEVSLGTNKFELVLYQYLGLYTIMMSYTVYLVALS